MEVIFLGTTAAIPSAERGHSAIALRYEDEVILWDCGEATQRQLIRSKTSYMRIKKIFVTHFHGDHFLGLPGLIQTMSFYERSEPLRIYGPRGIGELVDNILSLGVYDLGFKVETQEIKNGFETKEKKYKITCLAVKHSTPTYGLVFEEVKGREFILEKAQKLGIPPGPLYSKLQRGESVVFGGKTITPEEVLGAPKRGIRVVYSSDTRPCEAIAKSCSEATLIHDSTFDDELRENAEETKHSTNVEAAQVAKQGGAAQLFLTHISPRYKTDEVLLAQAQKVFKKTMVAKDLLRVEL